MLNRTPPAACLSHFVPTLHPAEALGSCSHTRSIKPKLLASEVICTDLCRSTMAVENSQKLDHMGTFRLPLPHQDLRFPFPSLAYGSMRQLQHKRNLKC